MFFKACRNGIVAAFRALPDISRDLFGVVGAGLVAYGAWSVYAPAGFIVAGVLILLGVFLSVKD